MKVPYFFPWITENDNRHVLKSLKSRWLTNGPYLEKFENKISSFVNTKYSIGVGSATQALHLSLLSLNVQKNDEIIVPTFTFAATSNSVLYCGATPKLVDVEYDTFNISVDQIKKSISKKTRGIIVVHYGGQSANMDEILDLAKRKNLFVIEDCAHALGSTYKKKKCGSMGIAGCFSFYPTKIITTGEGGMISTNNFKIKKQSDVLRSQGMNITAKRREKISTWKYDVIELGYNYRLDEIRSSLGLSQLQRISEINKRRQKIAKKYDQTLKNIKGITIPKVKENRNHIYHLYTIKIESDYELSRDELYSKLSECGIGTSVQYYPLHLMSIYKNKFNMKNFPIANKLKDQILSLPIFPTMSEKQIDYVISKIKNI